MLGVKAKILKQYGAVSVEVAQAMAKGTLVGHNIDYAIAITGIAGPDGGSQEKPVGTVCFGLAFANIIIGERLIFGGDRQSIREQATIHALKMLIKD